MDYRSGSTKNKEYAPPSREIILKDLELALNECKRKIESGRVYDPENEKVRISWIKAFGYLVNAYRQLIKDNDLEELKERIERLEGSGSHE